MIDNIGRILIIIEEFRLSIIEEISLKFAIPEEFQINWIIYNQFRAGLLAGSQLICINCACVEVIYAIAPHYLFVCLFLQVSATFQTVDDQQWSFAARVTVLV